jgi:putative ABC transport system permease protein
VGTGGALWLGQRFIESGSPFVLDPATIISSSSLLIVAGIIGSALSVRLVTRIDPIIALGRER